jgi:hypothetical protein
LEIYVTTVSQVQRLEAARRRVRIASAIRRSGGFLGDAAAVDAQFADRQADAGRRDRANWRASLMKRHDLAALKRYVAIYWRSSAAREMEVRGAAPSR